MFNFYRFLTPFNRKCLALGLLLLFFSISVFSQNVNSVEYPLLWKRFPSQSDIQNAYNTFLKNQKTLIYQEAKRNDEAVISYNSNSSALIKYHGILKTELKYLPKEYKKYMISGLSFVNKISYTKQIRGTNTSPWNEVDLSLVTLFFNERDNVFYFSGAPDNLKNDFDLIGSQEKSVDYYLNEIKKNLDLIKGAYKDVRFVNHQMYPGWATDNIVSENSPTTSNNSGQKTSDTNIPWSVVIGAIIGAAAIAAIRKKLKNKKKTDKKSKKKEKEKEPAHYILQLSHESFDFTKETKQNLTITVWKITEKDKKKIPANIQIQNPEPALQIKPNQGNAPLNCQLELKGQTQKSSFDIAVNANAEGHQFQKRIRINTGGEKRIVFETAPDNKRSFRPDVGHFITLYAQVQNAQNEPMNDLSKGIVFTEMDDWVDISAPVWDEGWVAINIEASNPKPTDISSHPPKEITVQMRVDITDENEDIKESLEEKLNIQLLDCKLESEIYNCSFPAIEEKSDITFKVWLEDTGDEKDWNLNGIYRTGVDIIEKPLTEISIKKIKETSFEVTLTGPILYPPKGSNGLTKTLVLSAYQKDEKPLEAHITVSVSKEGLFIQHGVNKQNEFNFLADKKIEQDFDFELKVYDEKTNQIISDKTGLQNLNFELITDDKQSMNLISVLLPTIEFMDLHGNIPYGRYRLQTQEDIPGTGNIIPIKYRVKAPIKNTDKPELFETILTINVKTFGIGSEFPDWVKAYEECKHVVNTYVPSGKAQEKLRSLLEERKMTLGAEGMVELRNRIWKIASNLILAEGAEGYKDVDRWATAIETTLEWTEWAGDIAFSALIAYATGGVAAGGLLATGAGMIKGGLIDALNLYIHEPNATLEDFWKMQTQKFVPMMMNMAKGRLLSIENIELIVRDNKILAWTIFISAEFLYNLYQTKSVYEAGKLTAKSMVEEVMIRKLTKELHAEAMNRNIAYKSPKEFFDEIEKYSKVEGDELILDQKKLLEIMRDPAQVRTIKDLGSPKIKKIFETSRNRIYTEHDFHLKQFIKDKYGIPKEDIIIDDFRTPGAGADNVNTDRDYRVLRKIKHADGSVEFIELQKSEWLEQSYKIFGNITGKPKMIDAKTWASKHQQRGTDKYDAEACSDYSDHRLNPKTGEIEILDANIKRVKNGEGRLIDADAMGDMYKTKVDNALDSGSKTEAYAQLQKAIKTLESVREGYRKQDLDIPALDSKLKIAMSYAKKVKTRITSKLDPFKVENIEKNIKSMTGYDLKKLTNDIEKGFKNLKEFDKGIPK